MIEKIAAYAISFVFIIGGVMYLIWGGPEGEVLPIPQIRASFWYRLILGSFVIIAGVFSFIEAKRSGDKKKKN